MIPKRLKPGKKTVGLLYYLYGPGRANEHEDPHLVAAWAQGVRDPARDSGVTMTYLAALLDAPVQALAPGRRPAQHVYHVSVRVAPEDVPGDNAGLSDEQWAEVAREMMDACGMAPFGDPMGARWVAVRHAPDHIHIVATLARQDGKAPNIHRDWPRMQARARQLEQRYGLRLLASGDKTAGPALTRAELEKTQRSEREVPARTELGRLVRRAAATARTDEEFFAAVRAAGVRLNVRTGQAGEATGYAVAMPGDRTAEGRAVWFSGSRLAPDLSLPRVRERWAGTGHPAEPGRAPARLGHGEAWRGAAEHVHQAAAAFGRSGDLAAAGDLVALSDLLTVLGADAPALVRQQLRDAARAFERAGRAPGPRQTDSPAARDLRAASTVLTRAGRGGGQDAALAVLLAALLLIVAAAVRWHQQRGHAVHQQAAALAGWHLRSAVELTGGAVAARDARPPATRPALSPTDLTSSARVVEQVLPDLAVRIQAEAAWPALAATLTAVAGTGLDPAEVLRRAVGRRSLADAESVSEVLAWRLTRDLHRTATDDIPATSPIPAGIPRTRAEGGRGHGPADGQADGQPSGILRCGRDLDAPTLASVATAAVPEHADAVLRDPAAAALAYQLGRARGAGWDAPGLLAEVARTRPLDDADCVAQVLVWRLQGWMHRQPTPGSATGAPGAATRQDVLGAEAVAARTLPPTTTRAPGQRPGRGR